MAAMEKEFFWGCELNKDKREYSWDSEDEELSKADIEQKLVVSQACLGAKAKSSEKNIVEVTTTDSSDSSVTHTILNLQSGRLDQCRLSLGFPSSVVFKLVEGAGPVHLTGSVYQELFIDEGEGEGEEDSDDDEEAPNLANSEANSTSKKRPLPSETPKGPPKKLARVEDEEDESGEEEEDEDEDESSEEPMKMEVDKKDKQKKTAETTPKAFTNKAEEKDAKAKKTKKDSVEEDESEEESEEEGEDEDEEEEEEEGEDESGEDESEEDDDEDEEDESEEEDEIADSLVAKKKGGKPEQKKPLTNGVSKPGKKTAEEKEKPLKAAAKQQSTTKTGGKDAKKPAPKTPETLSMDQIKDKLKKTPSLPKKVDKFKNYMRSSFKMTDEGTVTKLWDWLQENRK